MKRKKLNRIDKNKMSVKRVGKKKKERGVRNISKNARKEKIR